MPRGRPRSFDPDKALDRALKVFWKKGYEGASLPDLTRAMGINRPSLYAAFGNKEALFRKAVERYEQGPAGFAREALELPTARQVVERLLRGGICVGTSARGPRGCLMVQQKDRGTTTKAFSSTSWRNLKFMTRARSRQRRKSCECPMCIWIRTRFAL